MATAISWVVGSVLLFLGCGVVACSALGSKKRARFGLRLSYLSLVMVALALGLAVAINFNVSPQPGLGLLWMALLVAAVAGAPLFCYHTFPPLNGSSDGDDGGGSGPGPPPPSSGPPGGGVPLPDADQARTRRRDHTQPTLRGVKQRRPAVEPVPGRAPAAPGRR